MEEKDWSTIKDFLEFYPSTRYSKDPNILTSNFIEHKLRILKLLANSYPDYSIGIFTDDGELIGVHFVKSDSKNSCYLQELLLKPRYRVGFTSLQLVKENLKRFRKNNNTKDLFTRVYDDNSVSINFFTKLGFSNLVKKEHYYHCWLNN